MTTNLQLPLNLSIQPLIDQSTDGFIYSLYLLIVVDEEMYRLDYIELTALVSSHPVVVEEFGTSRFS